MTFASFIKELELFQLSPRRINREKFFWLSLFWVLFTFFFVYININVFPVLKAYPHGVTKVLSLVLLTLVNSAAFVLMSVNRLLLRLRRGCDLNLERPVLYLLLVLYAVPVLNFLTFIALLIAPGSSGDNRYDEKAPLAE